MENLSVGQLKRFLLARQGLWPPRALRGVEGVVTAVRRLGCVQYDSIDIVGRNADLVLQARVADFRRPMLSDALYADRLLVDGWDKQMSILPIHDRPFFARSRRNAASHDRMREDGPLADVFPRVRDEIRRRGPLCSLDIESDSMLDWAWAPARAVRAALEALWFRGEISIARREGSRRYYDLTSRLLPESLRDPEDMPANRADSMPQEWPPSPTAVLNDPDTALLWRIRRRISGVGALPARTGGGWLGIEEPAARRRRGLAELVERGIVVPFTCRAFAEPLYRLRSDDDLIAEACGDRSPRPRATVIAPLDNLLWDRELVRRVFDFDYVWEVYKPESARRWGYYVLPILYGSRFAARFEPARDRHNGRLLVKRWWTEPGIRPSRALIRAIATALTTLARSDGLQDVAISPLAATDVLAEALGSLGNQHINFT